MRVLAEMMKGPYPQAKCPVGSLKSQEEDKMTVAIALATTDPTQQMRTE